MCALSVKGGINVRNGGPRRVQLGSRLAPGRRVLRDDEFCARTTEGYGTEGYGQRDVETTGASRVRTNPYLPGLALASPALAVVALFFVAPLAMSAIVAFRDKVSG